VYFGGFKFAIGLWEVNYEVAVIKVAEGHTKTEEE
jgi:hypothetical protein